jgi:DNA-binding transcriptional MerR regulator
MLGVQPAFLRRLDTEAVVQPARSLGGQRRYSQLEILMVEKVVGLAAEGLTLAGIRRLLSLEDQVRDLQRQLRDQQTNDRQEGPVRKKKR